MTTITATEIREHLGHGLGDRRVTVHRDGAVTYTGTTEGIDSDRHRARLYAGDIDDLAREIRRERVSGNPHTSTRATLALVPRP